MIIITVYQKRDLFTDEYRETNFFLQDKCVTLLQSGPLTSFSNQKINKERKFIMIIFFHYLICLEITTFRIKNLDIKISGRTQVFFYKYRHVDTFFSCVIPNTCIWVCLPY